MCCEVTTAIIGMVTDVMTAANAGVAWLMQTCAAFYSAKERTVRAIKLLGRVRLIVQPEDVDYKVKVKLH